LPWKKSLELNINFFRNESSSFGKSPYKSEPKLFAANFYKTIADAAI